MDRICGGKESTLLGGRVERRPDVSDQAHPWMGPARWCVWAVIVVGLTLRLVDFPARYEVRDCDEMQYMCSGLVLWEGMVPGSKASPSAPEIWMTWAYIAADSAYHFVRPAADQPRVPLAVRPYVVIDWALFKTYEDMSQLHRFLILCQILISCGGIYWAFRLGWHWGGAAAGVLAGMMVSCFPIFIEYVTTARPYADGWAFSLMALGSFAVLRKRRRWAQGGIFMGLAIASRIDMVLLLPLAAWLLWSQREEGVAFRKSAWCAAGVVALTILVVDPWFLTNLIGNLRVIATIRLSDQFAHSGASPKWDMLKEVVWHQGLGMLMLMGAGLFLVPKEKMPGRVMAALWVLLLVGSIFASDKPIRYQGAPFVAILFAGTLGAAAFMRRWPKAAWVMVAAVVALPLVQGVRQAMGGSRHYQIPDGSVAWVEEHVPPGTIVYLSDAYYQLRPPLPTEEAADALWGELTNGQSWRRKFEHGLARFNLDLTSVPRAMSEENLIPERSFGRRWFILGNGTYGGGRPRYDLRIAYDSPTFWIPKDLEAVYKKTGGVMLCWGDEHKFKDSQPLMEWRNSDGLAIYLYCSDDVKARLVNYKE